MRASELLESQAEQDVRNCIDRKIIELQNILNHFDIQVNASNYQDTVNDAIDYLKQNGNADDYIRCVAVDNTKLQKSFNKLKKLRQQLIDKINSGV